MDNWHIFNIYGVILLGDTLNTGVYDVWVDKTVWRDAEVLWDYLLLHEQVCSADLLLVLGSVDDRVARYAAELTNCFDYGTVMFSGGIAHSHDLLVVTWAGTEAAHFYDVFQKAGGEARKVLIEQHAQNTGENATFCYDLLQAEYGYGSIPKIIQIVAKPYMQRRARATFEAQWPDTASRFFVSAPQISFRDYPNKEQPFERLVNLLVGDLQRIIEYPARDLQSRQLVPKQVILAWTRLVQQGYDNHLIQ